MMLIRNISVQYLFYTIFASGFIGVVDSIYDVSTRISTENAGSCAELDDRSMAVILPNQQLTSISYQLRMLDGSGVSTNTLSYGPIEPILVPITKATLVVVIPSNRTIISHLVYMKSSFQNKTSTIYSGDYGLLAATAFPNLYDGYAVSWTTPDNLNLTVTWYNSAGTLIKNASYKFDTPITHLEAATTFDKRILLTILQSDQSAVRVQVAQIEPLAMSSSSFSIVSQSQVNSASLPSYPVAQCQPTANGSGISCLYVYRELDTTAGYKVNGVIQTLSSDGRLSRPLVRYQLDSSNLTNPIATTTQKKPQLFMNLDGSWIHIEYGNSNTQVYTISQNGTIVSFASRNESIFCPNLNQTWFGVKALPFPQYGWEKSVFVLNATTTRSVALSYPFSYTNSIIESTNPKINSSVEPRTIEFDVKYQLQGLSIATGFVRVYRLDISGRTPRELLHINNTRVQVTNDTISIKLLRSSLNSPNSQYAIEIDDGAILSAEKEPLPGITGSQQIWGVRTGPRNDSRSLSQTNVPVELIVNGSISNPDTILELISHLLPINITRLSTTEVEPRKSTQQSKMKFVIMDSPNPQELGAMEAFQDLKVLIEESNVFQLITTVPPFSRVQILYDETYAARWGLISVGIVLLVLIAAFLLLRRHFPSSQNDIIFPIFFGLFGFIFDLLFVIIHGSDIPRLRLLIGIFFMCPYVIHAIVSCSIIVFEISRNTMFWLWFGRRPIRHGILASLAFTKIENLRLLDSQFCKLEMLSAPFSNWALKWISILSLCSIFFQDIPKLVILVSVNFPSIIMCSLSFADSL
ncbi:hypothetical protein K7432_009355 [Basidiobolus ranarum]|uniref:Transmembrane protein n=1 Tax=Basidiobolus ranarum TaxID=34480 RepID=A0ABR2VX61_9FUNG